MEQLLRNLLWETCREIFVLGLLLAPVFIAVWRLGAVRKEYRQKAVRPFTGHPRRPPGESLRLKLQELDDKLTGQIFMLLGLPAFLAAVSAINWRTISWQFLAGIFVIITVYVLWRIRSLREIAKMLWNYRLGFEGERIVGEELNQLMLEGYRVFHDLPFDGFNIDHVVVGPNGIFAVETKSKRKRTDRHGRKLEWRVNWDGAALHFPEAGPDSRWPDQAARNARALAGWLTKAVGEKVSVTPILVLPGWLIDRRARGEVNVLNEKEVRYALAKTATPLAPELVQRIAHQLSEKCRLAPAD
jgi:hypothetical protein